VKCAIVRVHADMARQPKCVQFLWNSSRYGVSFENWYKYCHQTRYVVRFFICPTNAHKLY